MRERRPPPTPHRSRSPNSTGAQRRNSSRWPRRCSPLPRLLLAGADLIKRGVDIQREASGQDGKAAAPPPPAAAPAPAPEPIAELLKCFDPETLLKLRVRAEQRSREQRQRFAPIVESPD